MANELKALLTRQAELLAQVDEAEGKYNVERANIDEELRDVLERIAVCAAEGLDAKPTPKRRTKKAPPQPDHDKVAKHYVDFDPAASGCLCGCGKHVDEGTNFIRNHDKKLKSIALAVDAGKLSANKMSDAGRTYAMNQGWIDKDA